MLYKISLVCVIITAVSGFFWKDIPQFWSQFFPLLCLQFLICIMLFYIDKNIDKEEE